jgi:hypothetical protein
LVAFALGGCVVPSESIRYARRGPGYGGDLTVAARAPGAQDRLVLVVANPRENASRLQACVADAMVSRLPARQPSPLTLNPEDSSRLRVAIEPMRNSLQAGDMMPSLPQEAVALDLDWIVLIEDRSNAHSIPGSGQGGPFGNSIGGTTDYDLMLRAEVFDLRARRYIGAIWAIFHSVSGVFAEGSIHGGSFVGGVFFVPPAGTSGLTLCEPLGHALGDALRRDAQHAS